MTELRSFIGFAQFLRRFIRNFSHFATPLTNLTQNGIQNATSNAFCSSPILTAPNWDRSHTRSMTERKSHVGSTEKNIIAFKSSNGLLYFEDKLRVPRHSVCDILQLAHDGPISVKNIKSSKTFSFEKED